MPYYKMVFIGIVALLSLSFLTGCDESAKSKRYGKAMEMCGKQGGVPLLNGYGRMTKCEFNPYTTKNQKGI